MNGVHLLVVEDDPILRRTLFRALTSKGYRVSTAPNGAVALNMLTALTPAAIVSDGEMPEVNGRELLAKLPPHLQARTVFFTDSPELFAGVSNSVIGKDATLDALFPAVELAVSK